MRTVVSLKTPLDILSQNGCITALLYWFEQAEKDLEGINYIDHAEKIHDIFSKFETEYETRFTQYDDYKKYAIDCLENPAKTLSFYANITIQNIFQELKFTISPPKETPFFILNKVDDKDERSSFFNIHRRLETYFRDNELMQLAEHKKI